MTHHLRYQDFINEMCLGKVHGVFIDDTGSPGLRNTPDHLHENRKSWIGVIVPQNIIGELWKNLREEIDKNKKLTGALEFHFTEIYNGKKFYRNISKESRLQIFKYMARIISDYSLPIFVQTLDPDKVSSIHSRITLPNQLGVFNLRKHEDLALVFLLLRIKKYLERSFPEIERVARVFSDEGYKKDGAAIVVDSFKAVFVDGLICFGKSHSILPIQLADFAAFCLNRTQLIRKQSAINDYDRSLLKIIEPIIWNYQNIEKSSL